MLARGNDDSKTHHCPVCRKTAKSRCVKQEHLEVRGECGWSWSLKHNKECPYCKNAREMEAQRLAKNSKKS
ncbi:hypothetical protein ACHAQD_010073 [Fusarium lateritium]